MPPVNAPHPSRRQWLALAAAGATGLAQAQPPDPFWRLLREGGCVVLMRHAQTEAGVGDPPGFMLGQCRTQRNLSAAGREQARRVGERVRREGVAIASVRSSAWCRCVDTAQLAFGTHAVWPALNSIFEGQGDAEAQTREVLTAVAGLRAPENWILVTHQVNISALTGAFTAMGELLATRPDPASPGRLKVLARLTV